MSDMFICRKDYKLGYMPIIWKLHVKLIVFFKRFKEGLGLRIF